MSINFVKHVISVAMCTFNGEKYIEEQINSIIRQTIKPDQIVICDDGSTDSTLNILKKLRIKNTDVKIEIYRNPENLGYTLNFLQALNKCKGDIIFLCDQDDIWNERKIQNMIKVFDVFSDALAVSCAYDLVDNTGKQIKNKLAVKQKDSGKISKISWREFILSPRYPGMAMAIRSKLICNLVDIPNDILPSHDWLLNEAASFNGGMYYFEKILTHYRQHASNCIGAITEDSCEGLYTSRIHTLESFHKSHETIIFLHQDEEIQSWGKKLMDLDNLRRDNVENKRVFKCVTSYIKNRKNMTFRCFIGDLYTIIRMK